VKPLKGTKPKQNSVSYDAEFSLHAPEFSPMAMLLCSQHSYHIETPQKTRLAAAEPVGKSRAADATDLHQHQC